MTVALALRLPSVRRGAPKVLAGRDGLGRRIRWAHASEVRNIADLLQGGELLLTTGMGLPRRAAEQRRFVAGLADRGVAGLVLELGQVLERAPGPLLEACEARGLPLVVLEREVAFVEITEAIHGAIIDRQMAVLRRGDELHRQFTELMVQGASVPEILAVLAAAVSNPVLLERAGGGVLYHEAHQADPGEVLAAWEAVREDGDAGPDAVVLPVATTRDALWGRIVALPLDRPLDDFDRVAVERAVPLISLALLRSRAEELLETRERGNFLGEVVAGRIDPRDAAQRAETLGFAAGRGGMLLPVAVVARRDAAGPGEAGLTAVWRDVRTELEARRTPVLIGARPQDDDTLVVLGMRAKTPRAAAMEAFAGALSTAVARHGGGAGALVVAAGAAVAGWAALPAAMREAAGTAVAARTAPPRPWHDATAPDVDQLLWRLRDAPELQAFAERRLGPLLEHDRRRAMDLVATLDGLYRAGGHKTEAARRLHLTRQSLYGRLQRIEELLGADLDDPDTRLGLELALRVRRDGGPPA
jgi:purine catabolism regulator